MGKQRRWLERCICLAAFVAACGSTLLAGSAPGYLAWVEPVPLRFAPARTASQLPEMLAEHPPSPPPVASFLAKSSSVAVPGQPGVSDSVRSADLTAQPEEPVAPAAPTQDFVSGPEAMFSSAVPSTPPVFLVTPQMVVELMRMHGTNASMTTPYTLESPIFLPPAPPASRATYHSSPPPKP